MSLKLTFAVVALSFSCLQPTAFGQTARIAAETTQSIKKQENEMSALCSKIKKKMRAPEAAQFDKVQRAWLAFRDLELAFYEGNQTRFAGSQNLPLFVHESLLAERIKQLKEMLESWES
jgi:uncharacterized protein YecT (DUF1311 family)